MKKTKLMFSPRAWSKVLLLRDMEKLEVGMFGITGDDPLYVEDVIVPVQVVTCMSTVFDEEAMTDLFIEQVELGRQPNQFARIWIHTHPGGSAQPSPKDESTFEKIFGENDWAVMFILATDGKTSGRLNHNKGPKCSVELEAEIDWEREFEGTDFEAWMEEYVKNVTEEVRVVTKGKTKAIMVAKSAGTIPYFCPECKKRLDDGGYCLHCAWEAKAGETALTKWEVVKEATLKEYDEGFVADDMCHICYQDIVDNVCSGCGQTFEEEE